MVQSEPVASADGRSTTVTFTAATGYNSYTWKIDGVTVANATENTVASVSGATLSADGATLSVNIGGWAAGAYDLALLATDSAGAYYSYAAQIIVSQ